MKPNQRHQIARKMKNLLGVIYENGADLVQEVKARIALGDDVNSVTEYGESALRVASRNGRFDAIKVLLGADADPGQLCWSHTIHEVVFGTTTSVQQSVEEHADLESIDYWQRTPFLFAVQLGDTQKAQLLLDLGANRLAVGRCAKTPMQYAVQANSIPMLRCLLDQGFDIESTDEYLETPLIAAAEQGSAECVEFLIACGADIHKANHIPERPIAVAANLKVVRILVRHGADINDINAEMHASLLGIGHESEPEVSRDDYLEGKNRRFGVANPEHIDNPFWLAMVRAGGSAWQAIDKFADSGGGVRLPVWCYRRFGRSTTILDDGRIIEIAGEHEDHYDPDFCIYNDVTEFKPDGSIRIFGYPEHVFPPTDFHTATLLDDSILITGCLGYPAGRQFGCTPVYRLNVTTFEVQAVETRGEQPGRIHRHKVRLDGCNRIIVSGGHIERGLDTPSLENIDEWALDLTTWVWTRISDRKWPQWTFIRADRKPNHLWHIRQALWHRNAKWKDESQKDMQRLSESLGHEPDLDAVGSIYQVEGLTSQGPIRKAEGSIHRVSVGGVVIRLEEDRWRVHAMVEGALPDATLKAFQAGVLANLARLEGVDWQVDSIGNDS
jgi:ankyrin repeat protein